MTLGSLFSGVGGFDLAFERAGFTPAWQVEIDPACQDVLARHWPEVERHGDVREVGAQNLAPVDAIVGGFPCQDISVAGRRAGLAGARSGLWWEFHRILGELRPAWVVIENVPGLLSSNGGRDLGAILGALGDLGYGWAYRVLDAQWFGVAQRRRRVFIVGSLGSRRAAEVLLEPEGGGRHTPPSRTARARVAASLTAGTSGAGVSRPGRRQEDDVNVVAGPIGATSPGGGQRYDLETQTYAVVSHALAAPRTTSRHDGTVETFVVPSLSASGAGTARTGNERTEADMLVVAHALTAEGHDASEDGTGRGTPIVAIQDVRAMSKAQSGLGVSEGGPMYTLDANAQHAVAIGRGSYPLTSEELAQPVTTRNGDPGHVFMFPDLRHHDERHRGMAREKPSLHAMANDLLYAGGVRRLTPTECERLMGWPDGWTEFGASGKRMSDSARYRMCGNGLASPVGEWIARRVRAVAEGGDAA